MLRINPKFIKKCLALSENKTEWIIAKSEWQEEYVYVCEGMLTSCLCGHAIKHVAICINKINHTEIKVGSTCIKSFFGIDIMDIIKQIESIKSNNESSFTLEVFNFLKKKANLNDWETKFYIDTYRNRQLTEKQLSKRIAINKKILKDCFIEKKKEA